MRGGRSADRSLTRLLLLAIRPLGDGEVDLLAGRRLGFERLLEAVPHQRGAYVGVADVGHPRRAPEGHRRRRRRHRVSPAPPLLAPPSPVNGWMEMGTGTADYAPRTEAALGWIRQDWPTNGVEGSSAMRMTFV
jgi:hypothetical protein